MSKDDPRERDSRNLLLQFAALFLHEWQALAAIGLRLLPFLCQDRHSGVYEILDYDSTLELLDGRGQRALFHKRQKVRFLQDNVIAFQDYAWGEGEIFARYRCSPGEVVDRYQEGDRWNILISLRATRSKGDVETFHSEREVENGFLHREEWHQVEIRHATRKLRMAVVFPPQRRCRRALLQQRSQNRTTVLGPEHTVDLPDGRQQVAWETQKVNYLEVYTLRWQW